MGYTVWIVDGRGCRRGKERESRWIKGVVDGGWKEKGVGLKGGRGGIDAGWKENFEIPSGIRSYSREWQLIQSQHP